MQTERLILRPFVESDADSVYEYAKDPRVGPIAGWPPHTSVENSLEILRTVLMVPETYAVCLKEDGRAIGAIGLMIGGKSNIELSDREGEIGYWLGVPFWGRGIMPEAARELIRHAFVDIHLETLWCGYFEGNEKSRRVQEKCGFTLHHTNRDIRWKLMGDIRTEHITRLTREEWLNGFEICRLSERRELAEQASAWFSSKWSVPQETYRESIAASFSSVVPSWYLCVKDAQIIAGLGVIENDFHDRRDLTPNVCAVFTEPNFRGLGIAGKLLCRVCEDMKANGIDTLYLLTDHTGFYERYGWIFYCMAQGDGEEMPSRMYVHYEA